MHGPGLVEAVSLGFTRSRVVVRLAYHPVRLPPGLGHFQVYQLPFTTTVPLRLGSTTLVFLLDQHVYYPAALGSTF